MTRLLLTVSLTALIAAGSATHAREIGTVAAVKNEIEGTPPDADTRQLQIKDRLIQNERVISSRLGTGQFIFLDQTALTVAPNSEVILDKYVFDPDTGTGEMALTLTKGAMRFIGGRISKKSTVTINTPTATMGVRGAILGVATNEVRVYAVKDWTYTDKSGNTLSGNRPGVVISTGVDGIQVVRAKPNDADPVLEATTGNTGGDGDSDQLDEQAVGQGLDDSLDGVNFDDPDTPNTGPISTEGESQPNVNAEVETPPNERRSDPVVSEATQEDPDVPTIVPIIPPGDGPVLENLVGGFIISALVGEVVEDDFDGIITNTGSELALLGEFTPFLFIQEGSRVGPGRTRLGDQVNVTFEPPETKGFFDVIETPGVFSLSTGEENTPVDVLSGRVFSDPDADFSFFQGVVNDDTAGGSDPFAFAAIIAEPTEGQLLGPSGDDLILRDYKFHRDILQDTEIAFAQGDVGRRFEGATVLGAQRFAFLPEPNNVLVEMDPFNPETDAFFSSGLFAQLYIDGEGPGQSTYIASATPYLQRELPAFNGGVAGGPEIGLFGVANVVVGDEPRQSGRAFINGATGIDAGATLFGPDANYFILGSLGDAFNEEPERQIFFSDVRPVFGDDGTPSIPRVAYAPTHLAELTGTTNILGANRANFGIPATQADAFFNDSTETLVPTFVGEFFELATTGGYASAHGADFSPVTNQIELFNGTSQSNDGIRFGFRPEDNYLAAGLTFQITPDADPEDGLNPDIAGDTVVLNFGDRASRSAYFTDKLFGAEDARFTPSAFSPSFSVNRIGDDVGRDPREDGRQESFRGGLFTADFLGVPDIFPDSVNSEPEYLRWGWWHGHFRRNDNSGVGFRTNFDLGVWVTGVVTPNGQIPMVGTATFGGFAIANVVQNDGFAFVDAGEFSMNYNFAEGGSGVVTLDGFGTIPDPGSINVSGGVEVGNHYAGAAAGTPDVLTYQVQGSFFAGGGSPIAATAGSFQVEYSNGQGGVDATATGVFGGDATSN